MLRPLAKRLLRLIHDAFLSTVAPFFGFARGCAAETVTCFFQLLA